MKEVEVYQKQNCSNVLRQSINYLESVWLKPFPDDVSQNIRTKMVSYGYVTKITNLKVFLMKKQRMAIKWATATKPTAVTFHDPYFMAYYKPYIKG